MIYVARDGRTARFDGSARDALARSAGPQACPPCVARAVDAGAEIGEGVRCWHVARGWRPGAPLPDPPRSPFRAGTRAMVGRVSSACWKRQHRSCRGMRRAKRPRRSAPCECACHAAG